MQRLTKIVNSYMNGSMTLPHAHEDGPFIIPRVHNI